MFHHYPQLTDGRSKLEARTLHATTSEVLLCGAHDLSPMHSP